MPAPKTDLNDLLKRWQTSELSPENQAAQMQAILVVSQPLIEHLAEKAGALRTGMDDDETWSAEYEKAVEQVVAMALTLDETTLGRYKNKLARKMRMLGRDFNNALAGKKRDSKKKKDDEIPVLATFGGWFQDDEEMYFVDYYLDYAKKTGNLVWRALSSGVISSGRELLIKNNGRPYKLQAINPEEEPIILPSDGQESASVVMPPGMSSEPVELRQVLYEVIDFIKQQYLFDEERTPFIIGISIVSTWVYENFRTLSYLRAFGDAGSGKSELMRRAGHLCYRLTKVSGGDSESVFFRITDMFAGTVFVEEADMEKSAASSNIVKFYNMGAMDGNYVNRSEEWINPRTQTKTFRVRGFRTFCPKFFCQREDFDDNAVRSRSLDIRLTGKSMQELKESRISLEMGSKYWEGWNRLVPRLLRLRMQMRELKKVDQDLDLADVLVSPRLNQVTMPIKLLAKKVGDQKLLTEIERVLREKYQEETAARSMETDARVVEALWKMYTYPDLRERFVIADNGEIRVKVGEVTAIANNIIEEMQQEGDDLRNKTSDEDGNSKSKRKTFTLGHQRVGKIMRDVIQLKRLEQRTNQGFFCVWDDVKMEVAGRRYGVLPEESKIEAARQALALKNARINPARKPLQMSIESQPTQEYEW